MLLRASDRYNIRHAMKNGLEYDLTMETDYGTLTITVRPAPPVWGCAGITQVKWTKGGKLDQQWQSSMTGVREALERGPYWSW